MRGFPIGRVLVVALFAQSAAAYTFQLDRLEIHHSGGTVFLDEFDDGVPPPSVGYAVMGTVGPEAGGLLTLDEADAVPALPAGSAIQNALQFVSAPLTQDFSVSARYELVLPGAQQLEGQAVFLAYVAPPLEVHTVLAAFQSTDTLPLALTLFDVEVDTGTLTVYGILDVSALITGAVDQVEAVLSSAANSGTAEASINVYDGGALIGGAVLPASALLAGTVIPSAGFQVFLPEPGSSALLAGAVAVAALSRRRRARRAPYSRPVTSCFTPKSTIKLPTPNSDQTVMSWPSDS